MPASPETAEIIKKIVDEAYDKGSENTVNAIKRALIEAVRIRGEGKLAIHEICFIIDGIFKKG